jgi:hypothetical protein
VGQPERVRVAIVAHSRVFGHPTLPRKKVLDSRSSERGFVVVGHSEEILPSGGVSADWSEFFASTGVGDG